MFPWFFDRRSGKARTGRPASQPYPELGESFIFGQEEITPPLSADAIDVLKQAVREACRFNHEYIGSEHILLGLAKADIGDIANVLRNLGVTADRLLDELKRIVQPGAGWELLPGERFPLTPRGKSVIKIASQEAAWLKSPSTSAIHLLLGLLSESEGVACHVLVKLGIQPTVALWQIYDLLGSGPSNELNTLLPREFALLDRVIDNLESTKQVAVAEHDFDRASWLTDQQRHLQMVRDRLLRLLLGRMQEEPPAD